jgi:hypothetical protein
MSEVKSFTIDRATWLHGEGSDDSYLLRPADGKMCCLGHYLKAVGIEEEAITSVDTPSNLPVEVLNEIPSWLLHENRIHVSSECQYLMKDNDDTTDSRNEKEANIIAGFKEVGIDVSFTGRYSK